MSRRVLRRSAALTAAAVLSALAAGPTAGAQAPSDTVAGAALGQPRLLDGRLFFARQGEPPADADAAWRITELPRTGPAVDLDHRQADPIRDLDVGRVGTDGVALTFSRCGTGGCRVHQLDPATGRDVVVARAHLSGGSESQPTRWLDALAFVSAHAGVESVYVRDLGHGRPARRVFGPLAKGSHVMGMDIAPRGLAFVVQSPHGEGIEVRVYVKPTGRPVRRVQRVASGALSRVIVGTPQWHGNDLLWTYSRYAGDPRGLLLRTRVVASGITFAQATLPVTGGEVPEGVAVDPFVSGSPFWIRVQRQDEQGDFSSSALRRYEPTALPFGPIRQGLGLTG